MAHPFSAPLLIGAGIDWMPAGGQLLVPYRGQVAVVAGHDGTGSLADGAPAMTEKPPLQWGPCSNA